jgi:hypothetical protein
VNHHIRDQEWAASRGHDSQVVCSIEYFEIKARRRTANPYVMDDPFDTRTWLNREARSSSNTRDITNDISNSHLEPREIVDGLTVLGSDDGDVLAEVEKLLENHDALNELI